MPPYSMTSPADFPRSRRYSPAKPQPRNRGEVTPVAGCERQTMLECRRGNQGVWQMHGEFAPDAASALGDRPVNDQFAQRSKKTRCRIRACTGEQLGPRHHRIEESILPGAKLSRSSQVVDEDIGIDEDVSHGPIRSAPAPALWDRRQRCWPALQRHRLPRSGSSRRRRLSGQRQPESHPPPAPHRLSGGAVRG